MSRRRAAPIIAAAALLGAPALLGAAAPMEAWALLAAPAAILAAVGVVRRRGGAATGGAGGTALPRPVRPPPPESPPAPPWTRPSRPPRTPRSPPPPPRTEGGRWTRGGVAPVVAAAAPPAPPHARLAAAWQAARDAGMDPGVPAAGVADARRATATLLLARAPERAAWARAQAGGRWEETADGVRAPPGLPPPARAAWLAAPLLTLRRGRTLWWGWPADGTPPPLVVCAHGAGGAWALARMHAAARRSGWRTWLADPDGARALWSAGEAAAWDRSDAATLADGLRLALERRFAVRRGARLPDAAPLLLAIAVIGGAPPPDALALLRLPAPGMLALLLWVGDAPPADVPAAAAGAAVMTLGIDLPTLRPAAAPIPTERRATVWLPDGRWWSGAPAPDAVLERGTT